MLMMVPNLGKVLAMIQNPEDFLVAKNTGKNTEYENKSQKYEGEVI